MKILILAGGTGTRLWPVSRKKDPKQIQPFLGSETLLKSTVNRMLKSFKKEDIFLSINQTQSKLIQKDLGNLILKDHYITEPEKRDTAAAIGFATMMISKKNPGVIIATVNSDHYLKNPQEYLRILRQAEKAVSKYPDHLVLIGLKPTSPETGYGYIKLNKIFDSFGKDKIYKVDSFKEKPDLKTAKKYLSNGSYLWNPAYFVFKAETMLDLFKKYLPNHYEILMKIKSRPLDFKKYFKQMEKISIDYGIMERAKKMLCLPAKFDWADVGHFKTIHETLRKYPKDNVVKGEVLALDSQSNLLYNYTDKLLVVMGLENMIVVETKDALLVCPQDKAQDVKKIVEELKKRQMLKYL